MEGRVKDRHMRNRGEQFPGSPVPAQIVRIVEWGQHGAFLDRPFHLSIDRDRLPETLPAVHDTVSDSFDLAQAFDGSPLQQKIESRIHCGPVIMNGHFAMQRHTGRVLKAHRRIRLPDPLEQPFGQQLFISSNPADVDELKFERGAAAINYQDFH